MSPIAPRSTIGPRFRPWLETVSPTWRWDWPHLVKIQDVLDRVTTGQVRFVIIEVPPRHGKSEQATVRYPVFRLERDPSTRVIVGAYMQTLANKFSRKSRKIARERIQLSDERTAAEDWETAEGGGIRAAGVGAGITGMGGDLIVIDDPVKSREEAESQAYRDRVWDWYKDDLYTRLEPGGAIIIQMTRWHEDDLVGRILASADGKDWLRIRLPALAEKNDPLGRKPGQALCPERYDEKALAKIRVVQGEYGFSALYQQAPAPAGGGIVKREWWRRYDALPPVFERVLLSLDSSFKGEADSNEIALGAWGQLGADVYLLDEVVARLEFIETMLALRFMAWKYPKASLKLVEDKANGPAIISTLRKRVPGIVAVEPDGDKVARARAASPFIEAGNIWLPNEAHQRRVYREWLAALATPVKGLPDPNLQPSRWLPPSAVNDDWAERFIGEWAVFPKGQADNRVDESTQAIRRLLDKGMQFGGTVADPGERPPVFDMPGTSDILNQRF